MEIVKITNIGAGDVYQNYDSKDKQLISSTQITPTFGGPNDYAEFFVYEESGELVDSNYVYRDYKPQNLDPKTNLFTAISIDPYKDIDTGNTISRGNFKIQYNFLRNLFNSSLSKRYFIKEVSNSRLELRLASVDLSNLEIEQAFNTYQTSLNTKSYYNDFYLNFGANTLVLATNVAYIEDDTDSYLLIKLYEPLPSDFDEKTQLWIVEKAAESVSYIVDIQIPVNRPVSQFQLRGANYNIKANNKLGQTTPYYNYDSLFGSEISSSIQQLRSWYEDKAIEINVDYTNFENFIHFSSATERINNFVYKLQLIEGYNDQIRTLQTYSGGASTQQTVTASVAIYKKNIDNLIKKFDTYEYYLYYSSESFSWPKSNRKKPYQQYSITSSQAINWLGSESTIPNSNAISILYSASAYDAQNQNRLTNSIPIYLVDDESNQPYLTFLDMVGQHFDNVWLYYKDISNRYNAVNNPYKGISKDLVADALRGMGMEIYTNSTISDSVYFSLFGINPDGSLLPPTGSEMIPIVNRYVDLGYVNENYVQNVTSYFETTYVTSSLETLPSREIEKEIYKRIYHNLPYLLKSRGTERGIKALLSCYGIPESILTVKEFGGYNRYSKVGILDQYGDKIRYYSSSVEISSSLLNPFSTLQYYSNEDYINSTNLEVAFSPSDVFNAHITSSLPNLRLENIIGAPGYLLSRSYDALDTTYETYLRNNYVKRYNLWDYVRLVKYYNNAVFKMVKDFVPARSNVTTGIVIKDHILHRNKYQRYDPQVNASLQYSQSIDTAFISAEHANSFSGSSTIKRGLFTSSLGYIPYTSSQGQEKYTGEFAGANITVTSLNSFNPQFDYSIGTNPNLGLITQSILALFQNVTESVRSTKFLDLDYGYQQYIPVNYNLIKYVISKSESGDPDWRTLNNDLNVPFSRVQDYNYSTNAFTIPRYYGSKVQSSKYTYYIEGESGSLGSTAAIDKIKYQFAYLVDIYTSSLNLPGRANSQIKYIIDNDQLVIDLTKANKNIFFTQNIFKSGETLNVSLFNYDPRNPDVQSLTDNNDLLIYEGGWRYSPILYKIAGAQRDCVYYKISPPEKLVTTTTYTIPGSSGYIPHPNYTPSNVSVDSFDYPYTQNGSVGTRYSLFISPTPDATTKSAWVYFGALYENYTNFEYQYIEFTEGNAYAYAFFPDTGLGGRINASTSPVIQAVYKKETTSAGSGTTTSITNRSVIPDCDMGTYKGVYAPVTTNSSSIWLSVTQSFLQYYNNIIQSASYDSMETPVFPVFFKNGDMVKLKDQVAYKTRTTEPERNYWLESEEYRIVNTEIVLDVNGDRRVQLNLDRPINVANIDSGALATPGGFPSAISYYIFNKHIPDETNVIIRYDPQGNITQDGILYPEYISERAKREAGNTIKSLRSQNLI